MRLAIRLFAVGSLLLPYGVTFAQTIASLAQDSKLPARIKASDLGDDMKAVKLVVEKPGNDIMSLAMSPLMMLGGLFGAMGSTNGEQGGQDNTNAIRLMDLLTLSWTNGSTYELYGQTYLVTYAPQLDFATMAQSKTPPDISKMDLALTLVNTKSISSITPRPDITKEEWMKTSAAVTPSVEHQKSETVNHLKQLSLGMIMYSSDFDDVMPYVQSTKAAYTVTEPYVKDRAITVSLNPTNSEFRMNMAVAGIATTALDNPAATPLYYDAAPWPDGTRCVSFMDGHVKVLSKEEWDRLQPLLKLKLPRQGKPLPADLGAGWSSG